MQKKAVERAKSVLNCALFLLRDLEQIDQSAVKNVTGLLEQEIRAKSIKDKVKETADYPDKDQWQEAKIDYSGVGGANRGDN